ncbi:S53 family peptidase [Paeniglutamicibacter kerguelensis]|uniref:Kumamolisin n=1 Tax=Paeniglutamicibacter kerguelensis TaxID=254788 RepID=A0ABS4XB65_9MICC|nr:S53 family peptidase [Paeniglutamicibacter kerguelensis]MBP2385541.1 kumamolisin [Paeniglutamicibacter kerguelensis]
MNSHSSHSSHASPAGDPPDRVPLPGSERGPAPDRSAAARPGVRTIDEEQVEISVYLRRSRPVPEDKLPGGPQKGARPASHGASAKDIDLVTTTLTELGAVVVDANPATRCLRVAGTAGLLAEIFGTRLERVTSVAPNREAVTHRQRTGGLSVPAALDGVVTAVLGLDDRPAARPHFHVAPKAAAGVSYTPLDLARIYKFPADTDGTGQVIAIIELGGGFVQADLDVYFADLGIEGPTVIAIGVDGAANAPGSDPKGADGEVMLDIEVAGALAPRAALKVYFAPNTDAGFVDAVARAAHDTPTPASISISWGQNEDEWTAQARAEMDNAFVDATLLGATATAAAGDNGSADAASDGKNHADFPASSPHALACGGTRLMADPATGKVRSETVWNHSAKSATGGGVSDAFPLPPWQQQVTVSSGAEPSAVPGGRGVPDVAAVADPRTGYRVRVDGKDVVFGGTSAVSPLWAALLARLAQQQGHGFGLLQPAIYARVEAGLAASGFRDIKRGNNGTYRATAGWDACTGLGVPDGLALQAAIVIAIH